MNCPQFSLQDDTYSDPTHYQSVTACDYKTPESSPGDSSPVRTAKKEDGQKIFNSSDTFSAKEQFKTTMKQDFPTTGSDSLNQAEIHPAPGLTIWRTNEIGSKLLQETVPVENLYETHYELGWVKDDSLRQKSMMQAVHDSKDPGDVASIPMAGSLGGIHPNNYDPPPNPPKFPP